MELNIIEDKVITATQELLELSNIKTGQIFVIGGSSSEIQGERIGTETSLIIGDTVIKAVMSVLKNKNIFLAVQGCEHINRALVIEKNCAVKYNLDEVNVIPHRNAGGAFATAAYNNYQEPVMVERIKGHVGIDIGDTFIGMHLKEIVVPVRLSIKEIGLAHLSAARIRARLIGGDRAKHF